MYQLRINLTIGIGFPAMIPGMPGIMAQRKGNLLMTQDQKIVQAKVVLLELAKQLGNGSQACKIMGIQGPWPKAA